MTSLDLRNTLRTGDALLFCSNTPTGFLLKTFTSSSWNHSGIAIRVKDGKISFDDEGELYILETNMGERYDPYINEMRNGAGISTSNYVFQKYNKVAVRSLHDCWRNETLAVKTFEFLDRYGAVPFPGSVTPFISIWVGISFNDTVSESMFCSELMAHYYEDVVGCQFEEILNRKYDGDLRSLFGKSAPSGHNMIKPETYSQVFTPDSPLFSDEKVVYVREADLAVTIIQPFLLTACAAMLVVMFYTKL